MSILTNNIIINPVRISAWMGKMASKRLPSYILLPFLKLYIWYYRINMDEFDLKLKKTRSFNEFFIRRLKPGVRQFSGKFMAPSDSQVTDYGLIDDYMLLNIKGMECSLGELFFNNELCTFNSFSVFYLSPANYHRFHAPFDFVTEKIAYVPGKLFSVKPKSVNSKIGLYCQNRRAIIYGNSEFGRFAMILVGAKVVGRIVLNFFRIDNRKKYQLETLSRSVKKGEEIGYFELGSTVIIMMESDMLKDLNRPKGSHVLVGECLFTAAVKETENMI